MNRPQLPDEKAPEERRYGRRVFLGVVGAGLSSLAWGNAVWQRISGVVSPVANVVLPFVPSTGWRIYAISGSLPEFDPATWTLSIGGLVARPIVMTYADVRALPHVHQVSTFHCVTGWTVRNVHWGGVRIADVIGAAGPLESAHAIQFVSAEYPYQDYLTIEQASLPDVMLADEMDGRPLTAPARRAHAARDPRDVWLQRREVDQRDQPRPRAELGYWEFEGYDQDAWVRGYPHRA